MQRRQPFQLVDRCPGRRAVRGLLRPRQLRPHRRRHPAALGVGELGDRLPPHRLQADAGQHDHHQRRHRAAEGHRRRPPDQEQDDAAKATQTWPTWSRACGANARRIDDRPPALAGDPGPDHDDEADRDHGAGGVLEQGGDDIPGGVRGRPVLRQLDEVVDQQVAADGARDHEDHAGRDDADPAVADGPAPVAGGQVHGKGVQGQRDERQHPGQHLQPVRERLHQR